LRMNIPHRPSAAASPVQHLRYYGPLAVTDL
jgi:hypothetical protein